MEWLQTAGIVAVIFLGLLLACEVERRNDS